MARPLGVGLVAALALTSGDALADTATWLHAGGGVLGFQEAKDTDLLLAATMAADVGVGTTVRDAPFSFGGLFRVQPVFGYGVDLDLYVRFCNRTFMTGPIGFAIDAGGYARFWGVKSAGFSGEAILGGPLGLQLAALGEYGSGGSFAFGGVLGFDLARLIVHRETLLDWWQNPRPDDAIRPTAASW
jgi:hypothetical protein